MKYTICDWSVLKLYIALIDQSQLKVCSGCLRSLACVLRWRKRIYTTSRAGSRRPGRTWRWLITLTRPTSSSPSHAGLLRYCTFNLFLQVALYKNKTFAFNRSMCCFMQHNEIKFTEVDRGQCRQIAFPFFNVFDFLKWKKERRKIVVIITWYTAPLN